MIFGLKTEALLDVWSIEHFFSGMALAVIIHFFIDKKLPSLKTAAIPEREKTIVYLIIAALIAFMWESVEFYLEAGYSQVDAITHWFQGVEFWGNRIITDPLITMAGAWCGLKLPKYTWAARAFSIIWLGVHIFVFPHSMYLQEHIFSF